MNEKEINDAMEKSRKSNPYASTQEETKKENEEMLASQIEDEKAEVPKSDMPIEVKKESQKPQELALYEKRAANALQLVDDIVLKNYLTKLKSKDLKVITAEQNDVQNDDFILFKIRSKHSKKLRVFCISYMTNKK